MSGSEGGAPTVHPLAQLYYVFREGDAIGPISGAKLVDMIQAGAIDTNTQINRVGDPDWISLASVAAFASYVKSAPIADESILAASKVRRSYRFADFWIRLGAYALDYLFTVAICAVAGFAIGLVATIASGADSANQLLTDHPMVLNVVGLVIGASYNVYFMSGKWQATPGKRICGIYIIRENGEPLTPLVALGRYLAYFLSAIILFVGFLMILWTDERKALHDIICGTRVVYGKL